MTEKRLQVVFNLEFLSKYGSSCPQPHWEWRPLEEKDKDGRSILAEVLVDISWGGGSDAEARRDKTTTEPLIIWWTEEEDRWGKYPDKCWVVAGGDNWIPEWAIRTVAEIRRWDKKHGSGLNGEGVAMSRVDEIEKKTERGYGFHESVQLADDIRYLINRVRELEAERAERDEVISHFTQGGEK